METRDTILDFESSHVSPENHLASTGLRLANFILDRIFFYIYLIGLIALLEPLENTFEWASALFGFLVLASIPGYWILFEYFLGKTPAKFITGTKVVTSKGKKIGFWQAIGRTFARFIPFEPFSFLGSRPIGWHDSLSSTRVVLKSYTASENEFV